MTGVKAAKVEVVSIENRSSSDSDSVPTDLVQVERKRFLGRAHRLSILRPWIAPDQLLAHRTGDEMLTSPPLLILKLDEAPRHLQSLLQPLLTRHVRPARRRSAQLLCQKQ